MPWALFSHLNNGFQPQAEAEKNREDCKDGA